MTKDKMKAKTCYKNSKDYFLTRHNKIPTKEEMEIFKTAFNYGYKRGRYFTRYQEKKSEVKE